VTVGSQVLLYFTGATLSFIAADIGGQTAIGWLPVANTLSIAAVCPFVGYMQDLFGKRYIALFGASLLIIGCAVMGTAQTLAAGLVGQAFAGAGAGIGELTGLAGLAETVPVKHRGYSLAVLTAFVLPFCPYVLYSELFSTRISWRVGPWISLAYNGVTGLGLLLTYFPHAHTRTEGMHMMQIIKRIDFMGGFLSITGLVLFLVALQAGGYTHPWDSAYVLATLLIGMALIGAWVVWEWKFASHPMIPGELFKGQRVVGLSFAVAFVAGMNFFSLLNFWPLTISAVYDPIPVQIGLRGISAGFATAIGAIFWNALLSTFPNDCKWILFVSAGMLTAFGGALSSMTPDNVVQTIALGTVACFGLGGVIVPAATVAMIAAPDALITTCAALSLSVRAVGGAIGYSIYFNIFKEKLANKLPVLVGTYAVGAGLPVADAETFVGTYLTLGAEAAMKLPGVTAAVLEGALTGSQWAYAQSLHYVWYVHSEHNIKRSQLTDLQVLQHCIRCLCDDRCCSLAWHATLPDEQSRCRALLDETRLRSHIMTISNL
jgi:MFS family permease